MSRSRVGLAVALALLAGCEDEALVAAQKAEKARKDEAAKIVAELDARADDPRAFADVMQGVGKARAKGWGDAALLEKAEGLAERARRARDKQLADTWQKVESEGKAALDAAEPQDAADKCAKALATLEKQPGPVLVKFAKESEALRRQLLERAEAARRATEVLARAKEMKEADANLRARALLRSFEVCEGLRASPFQSKVASLLAEIPEKASAEGASDADFMVIFDGSSEDQEKYFDKEHDYIWKLEDHVLLGDNSEYPDMSSTLWLGDDTWGDLVLELTFNVGDVGLQVRARCADAATFDTIGWQLGEGFDQGAWYTVRLELKGDKATWTRMDTFAKETVPLKSPKGKLGITLPGGGRAKLRTVKLKLLDKDAKKPEIKADEKPDKKTEGDDTNKKKKKKKKKGDDDKKDDDKSDESKPEDPKKE